MTNLEKIEIIEVVWNRKSYKTNEFLLIESLREKINHISIRELRKTLYSHVYLISKWSHLFLFWIEKKIRPWRFEHREL